MLQKAIYDMLLSDEKTFNIIYTSLRDGKNYAPTTSPNLYLFVDALLKGSEGGVETFQGRVDRKTYALLLKEARRALSPSLQALSRSPYRFFLHLLPKDVVAFQFFLSRVFPLLIASGASPRAMEELVRYLRSLPKAHYFKALRFLARHLKAYGSPTLALILALLKGMNWEVWKDE